jgi:PAT family beta-lactamase induction signal transducer AmpG
LQALGILSFAWLAHVGHNFPLMITSLSAEAFTMGMTTTVFLSLLMRICNPLYAATHFALLSACASLARIFTGPLASALVNHYHWQNFFMISFFSCIPGLILLIYLKPKLNNILFA